LHTPVLDSFQIEELFQARCADLSIISKDGQMKKFEAKILESCLDRRLDLTNMFLGSKTAALLATWIQNNQIDITHLLLG